jgi:hypothetical protein
MQALVRSCCLIFLGCKSLPSATPAPACLPETTTSEPLSAAQGFLLALRDRDTVALRRAIHPEMKLTTAIDERGGSALVLAGDEFIRVVARATGAPWNQRLLAPEVRVDGNLASIWSAYRFDRGAKFDHCGVIAMHLVRVQSEWRITQLSDTHRSTECAS